MARARYLQRGNEKVGRTVWAWTMTAVAACGDAPSQHCRQTCYAKAFTRYPSAAAAYARNFELAKDAPAFVEALRADLALLPAGAIVRVHVAGDFFSCAYAEAWLSLMRGHPALTFYTYTRAWRLSHIRPALEAMAELSNVRLWGSSDASMPKASAGWRQPRIFASMADARQARYVVCPEQTGKRESCSACGLCWRIPAGKTFRLAFIDHVSLQRARDGKYARRA